MEVHFLGHWVRVRVRSEAFRYAFNVMAHAVKLHPTIVTDPSRAFRVSEILKEWF